MICVSLKNKTLEEILEIAERPDVEMAEIRLDSCPLSLDDIDELFGNCNLPMVATCRLGRFPTGKEWNEAWAVASEKLERAALAGAHYVDLEIGAPSAISKRFQKVCKRGGNILIRSYHNYDSTPSQSELEEMLDRCIRYGADVVKIVTMVGSSRDIERLQSLYGVTQVPLIAFGMGEKGRKSRLEAIAYGAPFTFACISEDEATAPGQWTCEKMFRTLYKGRYERKGLKMPSSKSFAQRAILAAALADGKSTLRGYTPCEDSQAAIALAKALGAKVSRSKDVLTIEGTGAAPVDMGSVNVGESGLLARLSIPVLSHLNKEDFVVNGKGTLLNRPLSGAADIMAAFGVVLTNDSPRARKDEIHVPLRVRNHLFSGSIDISGEGGSQLISGLLMALPLCEKKSHLFVVEPKSIPYMFITADILKKFGIDIDCKLEGDAEMIEYQDWSYCTGISFDIKGAQKYQAADFVLESDWSAAANYLVAGAIFGNVEIEGLDMKSVQADLTIIDALVEAGAAVSQEEESGIVNVRKAPLEAFDLNLNHAPDLFPIISVLAAFCDGESCIEGIGRLKGKESNRIDSILQMLSQMGVNAGVEGDTLLIEGENLCSRILNGRLLKGGEYTSHHDHRMVMALKVASLGASSPILIDDEACVAKSFPEFRL